MGSVVLHISLSLATGRAEPMSPSDPPTPESAYSNLRAETLRKAAAIYLEIAYPGAKPPAAVLKRLDWRGGDDALEVMSHPPFEKVGKSGGDTPIFALRLGNVRYPHMKLQVQHWSAEAGYLLSVNTHDQVLALDPNSPDAAAFRTLQADNQRMKQAIEQAWDEAGLPIFLRYLRNYLRNQPDPIR